MLVQAERLTKQSFDAVTLCSKSDVLLGNHQTQTRRSLAIGNSQDQQLRTGYLIKRLSEYRLVICCCKQPQMFAKAIFGHVRRLMPLSGRQFGTTPCTATLENQATTTGSHAGTETVVAGALQHAGLESSFHSGCPG